MKIITHNGQAHKDDFFASAFLLYAYRDHQPIIERREPTEEELNDPKTIVIDVGGIYDPSLLNFDHHQISNGKAVCAFTQVLQHFKMRDYNALPWIKSVEVMDHEGPKAFLREIGAFEDSLNKLHCPFVQMGLSEFTTHEHITPQTDFIYDLLYRLGERIHTDFQSFYYKIDDLSNNAVIRNLSGFKIGDLRLQDSNMYSPFALDQWLKENEIDFIINHNHRGDSNTRLIRCDEVYDLNTVSHLCEYVHQTGFIACLDYDQLDEAFSFLQAKYNK